MLFACLPRGLVRHDQHAQALLELTFLLPLILMLCFSVVDISRALNQYLILSRVGYEGSRYAASLPGLETGCFGAGTSCDADMPQMQMRVRERVNNLLASNEFNQAVQLTTTLRRDEDDPSPYDNVVTVRINAPFEALFPMFNGLNISVAATAPYLYLESNEAEG